MNERKGTGRRTPLTRMTALVLSWILSSMAFVGEVAALGVAAPSPLATVVAAEVEAQAPPAAVPPSSTDDAAARGRDGRDPGAPVILNAQPLWPVFECIVNKGDGKYVAYWGYDNKGKSTVDVPIGNKNKFVPNPKDRGQPTRFAPGATAPYPNNPFSTEFDGKDLTWSLRGPDGVRREVTAKKGDVTCDQSGENEPPTIAIASPAAGAFLTTATPLFRVTYSDASGVNPASFTAVLDGSDRSASFTVGWTEATWTPSAAMGLASGTHTLAATINDTFGNGGNATRTFTVDVTAPVVTVASPAEGSYHRTTPTLTGTVQDLDPQTAVVCRRGETSVPATVTWSGTTGTFSCAVPLEQGANEIVAEATDRGGRTGAATRHLQFDSIAPQVTILEPSADSYTAATSITVSGGVADASPITILRVQGVTATVTGNTFTATGVPVGAGPNVTLTAEAEDAAGNVGTGTQTIHVDRTPPVVTIAAPTDGSVVPGRTIDVTGTVAEASPFTVDVNGEPATVTGQQFAATVTATVSGPLALTATARDAAAQTGSASVTVTVDRTAPLLAVTSPPSDLVTREPSVTVAGTVADDSAVTVTVDGTPVAVTAGAFSYEKTLPTETSYDIHVVATDAAGRTAEETITLRVDRTPPQVVVAAPPSGGVVTAFPIAVAGTVQDASGVAITVDDVPAVVTGGAWTVSLPTAGEGAQALHVVATDQAGNETAVDHPVVVDLGAPVVTITAPAPGTLTRNASVTVEGTVAEAQLTGVVVRGIAATITPDGPGLWRFTAPNVPLDEGSNVLQAIATDAAGQTGNAAVEVIRDSTPPQLGLQAPDSAQPGATVAIEAFPTDASGIARVDLFLGDALVASPEAPPYTTPVTIPAGTPSGTTVIVRAVAVDLAGNEATASRGIAVVSSGILAGQVLSDATSLPIEGASVRLLSGTPVETATDARGRYSVPVSGAQALLQASRDGHVSVERAVSVASGTGTIPVDARLTPLAAPVTIGPGGGSLEVQIARASASGPVTMQATVGVPAGAVAGDAAFRLTGLSAQGLPNLLPLGWAPVLAFDLRADAPVTGPLETELTGLPAGTLHLAAYSATLHGWLMTAPALDATGGALAVTLPATGAYALVRADDVEPPLAIPAPGDPLPSAPFVAIPEGAASTSTVTPAVLPPTGGTARGALVVTSPGALPSGTVVQAEVTETFTLVAGPVVSEEMRTQDLLLARDTAAADAPLRAEVPITAARTFGATDLVEGRVHLDILAGRESIRGATGGQQPVTVTDGDAMLRVPAGALPEDTVVTLDAVPLSPFLPQVVGLTAVAEVVVGLQGRTLGMAAELSVAGGTVPAGETLWLARIERPGGVPYPTVIGRAELVGGRVVTAAAPGLAGLRSEGRYVFFRTSRAVGFVTGLTLTSGGPIAALVQTAALPFVGLSGSDGAYTVLAEAGSSVVVSARALMTTHAGSETVEVVEGATASADILLAGIQTVATVTPADGATLVPTGARVEIRASAALAPTSVTVDTVRLIGPAPVPLRFLLSASGKLLHAIPEEPLLPDTQYTLLVSGLLDLAGTPVAVPATSFRTKDNTPPVYDTDRIEFTYPDANGQVQVRAEAGAMPSGTEILIINSGNGVVVSFTFLANGSVLGEFPATLNDQLLVTITDPLGNVTTFTRSQYVGPDGSTAVGAGGGTVKAADGSELRLPAGATAQAVRLKITPFDETAPQAQQPPSFGTDGSGNPLAHFGAGLTIESPDKPTFAKEVDIAFPLPEGLPENPKDAFFYVFRRLTGPNGEVLNEVIDQAFVEGEGAERKVVTASFPFLGLITTQALITSHFFLMYTYTALLPGQPLPGVITGKVLRAVWPEGASQPSFVPVTNQSLRVSIADPGPGQSSLVATTHPVTGVWTIWDPVYTGGNVEVTATLTNAAGQTETVSGIAVEANPANWLTTGLRFYRNIGTVNLTFPLEPSSGTPPSLQIRLVNKTTGQTIAGGIVPEGTPLKAVLTATNATLGAALLQGSPCTVTHPDPTDLTFGEVDLSPGASCPVSAAGSYTLTATGNPSQGAPITATRSLLVVVAGGGNTAPIEGAAPTVVDAQPDNGATSVQVTTLPQLVFSEPVTGIGPGIVTLREMVDGAPGPEVAFTPLAVLRNGTVVENPTVDAQVVSLTARPLVSLRYGTSYRLALGSGIVDLDTAPGPRALAPPTEWTFRTFAPTGVGGSEADFGSAGIALIGDRAFLAEIVNYSRGTVRSFDLSDPEFPNEIVSAAHPVFQRPVDLSARSRDLGVNDELAVGVTITAESRPSNLYLFDVDERERTKWIGITSVANSTLDGILSRTVFQGRYVYALTQRKGIQVIDTEEAKRLFAEANASPLTYQQMISRIGTEGQGFGQTAIASTIPYRYDQTEQWQLWDLDVASLTVGGLAQPIAFSVGEQRLANNWYLVSANPQTVTRVATTPLTGPGNVLFRGRQMALGRLQNRELAVVVGNGSFGSSGEDALGLRVLDVTNPATPLPLGFLVFPDIEGFSGDVTDVQFKGDKVLVAGTIGVVVVSVADVTHPEVIGMLAGAGGRLALGEGDLEGFLFSTFRSTFGGSNELGGVRTSALDRILRISPVPPVISAPTAPTTLGGNEETMEDVTLVVKGYGIPDSTVTVQVRGNLVPETRNVVLVNGRATLPIPRGLAKLETALVDSLAQVTVDGAVMSSQPRLIPYFTPRLTVDSNNDTFVDSLDDDAIRIDPTAKHVFWEGSQEAFREDALVDYTTVRITVPYDPPPSWSLVLQLDGATWDVKRKLRTTSRCDGDPEGKIGKAYLCHAPEQEAQWQSLGETPQPLAAQSGAFILRPELFEPGVNEFLVRCPSRPDETRSCLSGVLDLRASKDGANVTGGPLLSRRPIEFHPFKALAGQYTARDETGFDPLGLVVPVQGWKEVPADAKTVTVLVHGFNVNQDLAIKGFVPTMAKRLYWARTPILAVQGKAYVTGFLWPGDEDGGIGLDARFFYPEDEFNALRTGVPMSRWLDGLADGSPDRKVNIVGHSLGNMVVNNALKEHQGAFRSPITYAMVDAAIAAEAFDGQDAPAVPALGDHASAYGYPADARWIAEWALANTAGCGPCWITFWLDTLDQIGPNVQPPVTYTDRWSRPPGHRTAWKGFFSGNKSLGNVTMFNMYSTDDWILRTDRGRGPLLTPHAWFACQRHQKPNTGALDALEDYGGLLHPDGWRDGLDRRFWGLLGGRSSAGDLAGNEYLWSGNHAGNHAGLLRQWAELSFYLPALSGAAGAQPLATFDTNRNVDLTEYSGDEYSDEDEDRSNSHSYPWVLAPAHVFPVFQRLTEALPR